MRSAGDGMSPLEAAAAAAGAAIAAPAAGKSLNAARRVIFVNVAILISIRSSSVRVDAEVGASHRPDLLISKIYVKFNR
jgi:hypothetical protein